MADGQVAGIASGPPLPRRRPGASSRRARVSTAALAVLLLATSIPAQAATPTALISRTSEGPKANGPSRFPSISRTGRFVAFNSTAANLPGGDGSTNRVYRHDTVTGNTALVSRTSQGPRADGPSAFASISADGRFVAFHARAANLPGGDGMLFQVYRHDTVTGNTGLVSRTSQGPRGDGMSLFPSISANGRYVAFHSFAENLPGNDGSTSQIYRHDTVTGNTALVSRTSQGPRANGHASGASISANGRYVAFNSVAENLPGGDGSTFLVYVHDTVSGNTALVSRTSQGPKANAESVVPKISADGRYVAFQSRADNLPGNDGSTSQVYRHDTVTGNTALVSRTTQGVKAMGLSEVSAISRDGRFVAFHSQADNLPGGDGSTFLSYVHDAITGSTALVSRNTQGVRATDDSVFPALSGDGSFVAFHSDAVNLPGGDGSTPLVYRHGPR